MTVNVIYCLASVGFAIYNKSSAFFFAAGTFGKLLGFKKQLPHEFCVGCIQFHDVLDMFFGNYKKMYRRLRIQIMESQKFFIFVKFIRRNFSVCDFTKYAVFHELSISEMTSVRQLFKKFISQSSQRHKDLS